MAELLTAYWYLVVVALLVGVLVAWRIFAGGRRTMVTRESAPDDGPAKRNQALIDAAPVSAGVPIPPEPVAPPAAEAMAGIGEAVAMGVNPEPLIAALSEAPEPTPEPEPEPAAPAPAGEADDLTRIKGLGPKLVDLLAELGVTQVAQVAAWSEADIDRIDSQLGRFEGRIRRDNWVEQARLLAAGDTAGYEARFGKL